MEKLLCEGASFVVNWTSMKSILLLFCFITSAWASAPKITLYVFKSPAGIDWQSPRSLAVSAIKNQLYSYFEDNDRILGHISIDLQCKQRRVVTGMVGRQGESRRMVLQEDAGHGVLFHIFPGRLESQAELEKEIRAKQTTGLVHAITYLVDDLACDKMLAHYDNHIMQGGVHNYGFPLNTLAGEGGGCSAFGISFLQVAGIANPEYLKAWSGSVWVPKKYIGPHNTQRYKSGDQALLAVSKHRPVNVLNILLETDADKWGKPQDPESVFLAFFDPDTMFKWVEEMVAKNAFPFVKHDESFEVVLDARRP